MLSGIGAWALIEWAGRRWEKRTSIKKGSLRRPEMIMVAGITVNVETSVSFNELYKRIEAPGLDVKVYARNDRKDLLDHE